jgi:predicted enzyme involved in methoxymalonyl-ACP biosynthesis
VVEAGRLDQFVMSCRVLALDVEKAVVAALSGIHPVSAAG